MCYNNICHPNYRSWFPIIIKKEVAWRWRWPIIRYLNKRKNLYLSTTTILSLSDFKSFFQTQNVEHFSYFHESWFLPKSLDLDFVVFLSLTWMKWDFHLHSSFESTISTLISHSTPHPSSNKGEMVWWDLSSCMMIEVEEKQVVLWKITHPKGSSHQQVQ